MLLEEEIMRGVGEDSKVQEKKNSSRTKMRLMKWHSMFLWIMKIRTRATSRWVMGTKTRKRIENDDCRRRKWRIAYSDEWSAIQKLKFKKLLIQEIFVLYNYLLHLKLILLVVLQFCFVRLTHNLKRLNSRNA